MNAPLPPKRSALRQAALWIAAGGGALLVCAMAAATFAGRTEALGASAFSMGCAAALAASLALYLAAIALERGWRQGALRFAGLFSLHAGLLAVIAGLVLNERFGEKGFIYIREDTNAQSYVDDDGRDHALPFPIRCVDFRLSVYPGTLRPSGYASELVFGAGGSAKAVHLSVNAPAEYGGYEFYQQDYGIEPGPNPRIEAEAVIDGKAWPLVLRMGEPQALPDGRQIVVVDFSPSLGFKDGRPATITADAMLRPGYLIEVSDPFRPEAPAARQWVLPAEPESEQIAGMTLRMIDFRGIEYTVLSLARRPFDALCTAGFILCGLGMLPLLRSFAFRIRRRGEAHAVGSPTQSSPTDYA